jgi:ribosomal protein S18 acetylase RimI-like enzyme
MCLTGIEINETERGKGHGKEAMQKMEIMLKKHAFSSIKLHVFEQSNAALHIYKNSG